jgi:hypothetical protein
MLEIFSKELLARLNTEKYEAVPILEHLQGLNHEKDNLLP